MGDKTGISWTEATWNPATGCDKVSPGCDHCYAESIAHRFDGTPAYPNGFGVTLRPERLDQPIRWKRPRMIFVNSMSDLFHKDIPDEYIARVFAVMALAPRHTFQILTKRHGRMRSLLSGESFWTTVGSNVNRLYDSGKGEHPGWAWEGGRSSVRHLSNVWLGVSAEDQQRANLRIPALLDTPAAVRFVSAEPLLGRIDLAATFAKATPKFDGDQLRVSDVLHWVIVGGESGPGARPMHPDWARQLRDQCEAAGVAYFFKQRGEWSWNEPGHFRIPSKPYSDRVAVMHPAGMTAMTKRNPFDPFAKGHPNWTTRIERVGKKAAGHLLDGREHHAFPEVIR